MSTAAAHRSSPSLAPKRTTTITITDTSSTVAESAGGLAFEVKIAESPRHGVVQPPAHFLSPSAKINQSDLSTPLTPESITEKLKRAEERRLSLEQLRSTLLAAENSRPNEVSKIKDQQAEGKTNVTIRTEPIDRLSRSDRVQEANGGEAPEEARIGQGESRTRSPGQDREGQGAGGERSGYGATQPG